MSRLAVAWFARRRSIACMIALSAMGFIVPGLFAQTTPPTPIGTAIADTNRDFIPDHAGTTVTIGFSGGNADVYVSPDLQTWTELDTNVAPATFIDTGAPAGKQFYLLLPTGSPAP